jgi:sterol desaturase/sphingolipid hydroxylase (fatty acid hydroxylase superfamily)
LLRLTIGKEVSIMLGYVIAVAVCCFVLERIIPGWALPRVKTWRLRVVLVNLVQLGIILMAGVTWEVWLSSWSVFGYSRELSPIAGGVLAYFVATFVFYWWHRWRHEVPLLWRLFHQIHHSPQRIEVITSFYKHPGEMMVNSLLGSGLVISFSGLRCTAFIINTSDTRITTVTLFGGTCCSGLMRIPSSSPRHVVSMTHWSRS